MRVFFKGRSKKIDAALLRFFPRRVTKKWLNGVFGKSRFVFDEHSVNGSVNDLVWNFLDRGGKRWRPTLLLLSCVAVGGSEKKALPFCVIPELVHNGSIIVDDVEDNAEFRRGKPALHKLFGVDLAVNAGNLLYFLPLLLLFRKSSLSGRQRLELYNVYSEELLKLSFGQAMDIFWHKGKKGFVGEDAYLQMCSFKTGALASLAAKFGVIIGGGSAEQVLAFGDFAATVGVAFQIQDDVLNLLGAQKLGKDFGDDIREGKRSLPVIRALSLCSKKDAARLVSILDSHTSDIGGITEAIAIIKSTDALDYSVSVARSLVVGSWKKLDRVVADGPAKKELWQLSDFLVNRKF